MPLYVRLGMDTLILLLSTDYVALFVIIALGILLGRLSVGGVSLGVSGVIFTALLYGWFTQEILGVSVAVPRIVQTFGLILFVFTVGMQAGP